MALFRSVHCCEFRLLVKQIFPLCLDVLRNFNLCYSVNL